MFNICQKIPIFRYIGLYGHLMPQLNLLQTIENDYYLEWFLPGHVGRQTNIHLMKSVTKQDLQKLFSNTQPNNVKLFDLFNPKDGDAYNNLRIGPYLDVCYYKTAIFKPIDRQLIHDRLNTIANEPLQSPNNHVFYCTLDVFYRTIGIKTMLQ